MAASVKFIPGSIDDDVEALEVGVPMPGIGNNGLPRPIHGRNRLFAAAAAAAWAAAA